MTSIALIVEGPGDAIAFPTLVAKTGRLFDMDIYVKRPIIAGDFQKLSGSGIIERYVSLASEHSDVESVLVAIDLDDLCVLDVQNAFRDRITGAANTKGKLGRLCFCVREYEAWLIHSIEYLFPENSINRTSLDSYQTEPESIRGAKEALTEILGKKYKPTVHQNEYTKKMNLKELYRKSRSYRKFCKEITQLDYEAMRIYLSDK